MRISATVNSKALERVLREQPKLRPTAERAMLRTARKRVAPKVLTESQVKVPKLWRTLMASAEQKNIPGGVRLGYGAQASKYAARVHDDKKTRHSGPRFGKWVYFGSGRGGPGDKNRHWKTGKSWRRSRVDYTKRYPADRYPKVGQSHFLYGPGSAWDELEKWGRIEMNKAGLKAIRDELARAGAR